MREEPIRPVGARGGAAGWRRWFSASLLAVSVSGAVAAVAIAASACALSGDDERAVGESTDLTSAYGAELTRGADGGDLYAGLEGLHDDALKDALFAIVKNQNGLGYNRARQLMFRLPLLVPGAPLECVYTGRVVTPDGSNTPGGFNTEHSWPQSQGAENEPARSDLHHLFPVDEQANGARASYPFGEVTCLDADAGACSFANGGSALGKTASGVKAFEVRPRSRGDIARAQFYFSVRYHKAISAEVEPTLRAWHDQDPVDDDERTRNDNIDRAQHNRNPFVDRPEFVRQIADF